MFFGGCVQASPEMPDFVKNHEVYFKRLFSASAQFKKRQQLSSL